MYAHTTFYRSCSYLSPLHLSVPSSCNKYTHIYVCMYICVLGFTCMCLHFVSICFFFYLNAFHWTLFGCLFDSLSVPSVRLPAYQAISRTCILHDIYVAHRACSNNNRHRNTYILKLNICVDTHTYTYKLTKGAKVTHKIVRRLVITQPRP